MSSQKAKYETPVLTPLGEMARGSGLCETGSSVVAPSCSPGAADAAVLDCTAGLTATRDCTAGTAALRNCTAGVSALPACTMGTAATGACTAGGHVL
jgi:hypothetical protein